MAKQQNQKDAPSTPEGTQETRQTAANVTRTPDRVAMVSRRADGTADQTEGYEVLDKGEKK